MSETRAKKTTKAVPGVKGQTVDDIWNAYFAAVKPAEEAYDAAMKPAKKAYDAATKSAREARDRALKEVDE